MLLIDWLAKVTNGAIDSLAKTSSRMAVSFGMLATSLAGGVTAIELPVKH